jgi:radical SAM family uncharacterized protein
MSGPFTDLWPAVERLLTEVQAPSQYLGTEKNAVRKDLAAAGVTVALAFPDAYTIGMSHLGLQILYGLLNAQPDVAAERVFAPWLDMEALMRKAGVPLFSLESHAPVRAFDIVGFSLQDEMGYTNVLNLLDLAGIPLRSAARGPGDPLVVAGGPCAVNPEPLADFVDVVILGDAEEAVLALADAVRAAKAGGKPDREALLRSVAAKVPGAYVPALYDVAYRADGAVQAVTPRVPEAPARVAKAVVASFEDAYYPVKPVVPFAETVHDRINLEVMRGCPHGCRFCQSMVLKNKLRFRSVEKLLELAEGAYQNTGYDEIALTSLSSGDYPHIEELMARLTARFKQRRVGLTLPSLWISPRLKNFPAVVNLVRKSGFTFAPEAGSERLRKVIRKDVENADLLETARTLFREGWRHLKLYFMVGLPTETPEDVDAIVDLAREVSMAGKAVMGRAANVNVTVSPFVPKPHTPFQWEGMARPEAIAGMRERVFRRAKGMPVHIKFHDADRAFIEAALTRGDRRQGRVLEEAWRRGSKFEAWDECYSRPRWLEAFAAAGLDPAWYSLRSIPLDETLPWDHLDVGPTKAWLRAEAERARTVTEAAPATPPPGDAPAPPVGTP